MPPSRNMDDLPTIIRSGMWRLPFQLSPEGRTRFFSEFLPLLHKTKAEVLGPRDDESWYLVYIGTKESARGKGLARACIEEVSKVVSRLYVFSMVDRGAQRKRVVKAGERSWTDCDDRLMRRRKRVILRVVMRLTRSFMGNWVSRPERRLR